MARDPYAVLGVARGATPDEIKSAYRKLARQHHPDVNQGDPQAEEKFKEIAEAYSILSDPERKARFDRFGVTDDQGASPGGDFFGGAGGIQDLFEMFMGGAAGGGRRRVGRDGQDVRIDQEFDLHEVLTGATRKVAYRKEVLCAKCHGHGTADGKPPKKCTTCDGRGAVSSVRQTILGQVRTQTPCPTCGGEGLMIETPCAECRGRKTVMRDVEEEITVPAGFEDEMTMRIPGKGGDGVGDGHAGDLYVVLGIRDDDRFERDGQNLHLELPLTYPQAVLGSKVTIKGLDKTEEIEIKPGTPPNERIVLRGLGLPPLHGGRRGDLVAHTTIVVPVKPSERERELLKELSEIHDGHPPQAKSDDGGFFGKLFGKR